MNKKNIIALIIIIITLVIIFVLVRPMAQAVWHDTDEIITKKTTIKQLNDLIDKINQFKEIEEEAKKVFLALPEEKDIPNLLVQFDSIASSNGLILENISFESTDTDRGDLMPGLGLEMLELGESDEVFQSLMVNLSISGAYKDFIRYLKALEQNIRAMDVETIKFTSKSSVFDMIKFNLTVKVYFQ